jgi:glutathione S-transferase
MLTGSIDAPSTLPTLEVRRTIRAPRQRVFEAWTRPEDVKRWSAPGPLTVAVAEIDLRVGGAFRIHMLAPDGAVHRAVGVYREVEPPSRLVYTWSWEGKPEVTDTVITVDFLDAGDATEVVLRHDGLPNEQERDAHAQGWNGCLDKLASLF